MRKIAALFGMGFLLAGCAGGGYPYTFETAAADAPEAHIRFVQHGGIYDYHAVNDRLLYVQSRARDWYQVTLFSPCIGIEYANALRFLPSDGAGTFDRFSYVAMRGQRCKVESVKPVAAPLRNNRMGSSMAMRGERS